MKRRPYIWTGRLSTVKMTTLLKLVYRSKTTPTKTSEGFFRDMDKNDSKI